MWENLKAGIASVIRTNNNNEITGTNLRSVLNNIVNNVGANATFAGIANPNTNPGSPDGPVFYLTQGPGLYVNFGNLQIDDNIVVLANSTGVWQNLGPLVYESFDNVPTKNSTNPVTSSGIIQSIIESAINSQKRELIYPSYSSLENLYGINADGTDYDASSNYRRSDYLEVNEGDVFLWRSQAYDNDRCVICGYTSNNDSSAVQISIVTRKLSDDNPLSIYIVPKDVKYLRFSCHSNATSFIVYKSSKELYNIIENVEELKKFCDAYWWIYRYYTQLENIGQITSNGTIDSNTNYRHSNELDVQEGDIILYSLGAWGGCVIAAYNNDTFYQSKSVLLSSAGQGVQGEYIVPNGINKIRFCSHKNAENDFYVKTQVTFAQIVDFISKDQNDILKIQNILFPCFGYYYKSYNNLENAGQITSNGTIDSNTNYRHSDKINVKAGLVFQYALCGYSSTIGIAAYDENNNFISNNSVNISSSATPLEGTYTVPVRVAYLRFCSHKNVGNGFYIKGDYTFQDVISKVEALEEETSAIKTLGDTKNIRNMLGLSSDRIANIFACQKETQYVKGVNRFCLAHISDTHNNTSVWANFVGFINDKKVVQLGIHTGDILDISSQSFADYATDINNSVKNILLCIGNHDNLSSQQTQYEKYIEPIKTKLGLNTTNCFYSYINETYGIKIICMNEFANTDIANYRSFTQAQIDWFLEELDDAITNNQKVFVMMHIAPATVGVNDKAFFQTDIQGSMHLMNAISGNVIGAIINAFKNGSNVSGTYTQSYNGVTANDIVINHTFASAGTFIAYLTGHWHSDYIGYLSDYPNQLVLVAPSGNPSKNYSDLPRIEGDFTENCYNLYVVDFDKGKVYVSREGSNITYKMKLRQYEEYDF